MPGDCQYCASEPEPGWIETPNNGPIVPCPLCNDTPDRAPEYIEGGGEWRAGRGATFTDWMPTKDKARSAYFRLLDKAEGR